MKEGTEGEGEKKVKVNRVVILAAERPLTNACARRRDGGPEVGSGC